MMLSVPLARIRRQQQDAALVREPLGARCSEPRAAQEPKEFVHHPLNERHPRRHCGPCEWARWEQAQAPHHSMVAYPTRSPELRALL